MQKILKLKLPKNILLVFFISIYFLIFTRPLLEEWGLIYAFESGGLNFYKESFPAISIRPGSYLPSYFFWKLNFRDYLGVPITLSLLAIARFYVLRWAIKPIIKGDLNYLIGVLAVFLFPWPGIFLGRFAPAQLATLFYFLALGFAVRVYINYSFLSSLGFIFAIVAGLLTYQALALAILLIPFFLLIVGRRVAELSHSRSFKSKNNILLIFLIFISYATYFIYVQWAINRFGKFIYESGFNENMQTLLNVNGIWNNISQVYRTMSSSGLESLLALVFFIVVTLFSFKKNKVKFLELFKLNWLLSTLFLLFSLPLLSLTYISDLHLNDLERLYFPVSIGILIIFISLVAFNLKSLNFTIISKYKRLALVLLIFLSTFNNSWKYKEYADLQSKVISQISKQTSESGSKKLLLIDLTGTLGDVYTFLPPSLSSAMKVTGQNVDVELCTPNSVTRQHPDAGRYPIPTTVSCDEFLSSGTNYEIIYFGLN